MARLIVTGKELASFSVELGRYSTTLRCRCGMWMSWPLEAGEAAESVMRSRDEWVAGHMAHGAPKANDEDGHTRILVLEAAIRRHRDQKGDDRCWLDDANLYAVLPEGRRPLNVLPPRETFLANCARFHESRQPDAKPYVAEDPRDRQLALERAWRVTGAAHVRELIGNGGDIHTAVGDGTVVVRVADLDAIATSLQSGPPEDRT